MTIRIEFFGIARQRTSVSVYDCNCSTDGLSLAEILHELGERFPEFAKESLVDGQLRPEYIVNRGGDEFLRDPQTIIRDGETLLILSTDAGG